MALAETIAQKALAVLIAVSTIASIIATSPPNASIGPEPESGDILRLCGNNYFLVLVMAPYAILALHTCSLAYFYPNIPPIIYGYGKMNRLNPNRITWSAATIAPIAWILCIGVPLRLASYASLGKNFTFALAEPDRLTTYGIYQYLQHPSYVGTLLLTFWNTWLLFRPDGALSCWIPPQRYRTAAKSIEGCLIPLWLAIVVGTFHIRVNQEESMMQARFGASWEVWHKTTARLIPGIF